MNRELVDRYVIRPGADEVVFIAHRHAKLGDVLVTRGRGALSKAVLVGTGGRFSHAALFLDPSLFDAVEIRGTGRTWLEHVSLDFDHALEHDLFDRAYGLRLPPEDEYLWLRHPNVNSTLEESELEKALLSVASFVRYPNPSALVPLMRGPRVVRRLLASTMEWLEDWLGTKRAESGMFCSQLIALFFECAGVELFDPPRGDKVTPDELIESGLQPVEGVLVCAPRTAIVATLHDASSEALAARFSDEATIHDRELVERIREIMEATRRDSAPPRDLRDQLAEMKTALAASREMTRIGRELISKHLEDLELTRAVLEDFRESEHGRACERYLGPDFGLVADVVPQPDAAEGAPLTAGPDAGAELLRRLPRGTVVRTHIGDGDRWRVRLEDGTEGYVPRRHLEVRG